MVPPPPPRGDAANRSSTDKLSPSRTLPPQVAAMSAPHVKGNVAVLNQNWSAFFYFVAFVMLVAFILLNLYIGEGGVLPLYIGLGSGVGGTWTAAMWALCSVTWLALCPPIIWEYNCGMRGGFPWAGTDL